MNAVASLPTLATAGHARPGAFGVVTLEISARRRARAATRHQREARRIAGAVLERYGDPLLRVRTADDLVAELDVIIEDPDFHYYNRLLGRLAIEDFADLAEPPTRDVQRSTAFARMSKWRKGTKLTDAVADVLYQIATSDETSYLREHGGESFTVNEHDPLAPLWAPEMPFEIMSAVLDGLYASALTIAIVRADARPKPKKPPMAELLLDRWCACLHNYLVLLASIPGIQVSERIIPSSERLDFNDIERRHHERRQRIDEASEICGRTGQPVSVFPEEPDPEAPDQ